MNKYFETRNPITVYRYDKSGHCHRVELMMSLLDIPSTKVSLARDGKNTPDNFLQISPLNQVPVIDDNGTQLADSNAILVYLVKSYADDEKWFPSNPVAAAKVQRFLSVAAGELFAGPAIARFIKLFNANHIDYETAKTKTEALLPMLESTLQQSTFISAEHITIADIALYTYIKHAPEGGIETQSFMNIMNWLSRIEDQKGFIPMP